jgi:hypothetical protein
MLCLLQVFFSYQPNSKVSSRLWQQIAQLPRVHMFQVHAAADVPPSERCSAMLLTSHFIRRPPGVIAAAR